MYVLSYQGHILLYCSMVVVLSGFSFCHFSLLFPNFFSGLETGIQSNMVFISIFMCVVAVVQVVCSISGDFYLPW